MHLLRGRQWEGASCARALARALRRHFLPVSLDLRAHREVLVQGLLTQVESAPMGVVTYCVESGGEGLALTALKLKQPHVFLVQTYADLAPAVVLV